MRELEAHDDELLRGRDRRRPRGGDRRRHHRGHRGRGYFSDSFSLSVAFTLSFPSFNLLVYLFFPVFSPDFRQRLTKKKVTCDPVSQILPD